MRELEHAARVPARVYLTGGATAVLAHWRSSIAIDIKVVPEDDALFRAIPALKESLQVNVELYRYPAIDPDSVRKAVEDAISEHGNV